jgi:hypothetical protein
MLLPVIFGVFFIVVGYFLYKGRNWSRFGEIILLAGLSIISILATTVPQLEDILGKINTSADFFYCLCNIGHIPSSHPATVLHKQTAQYFKYIGEVGTISYKLSDKKPTQHAQSRHCSAGPQQQRGKNNQTSASPTEGRKALRETIVDTGLEDLEFQCHKTTKQSLEES